MSTTLLKLIFVNSLYNPSVSITTYIAQHITYFMRVNFKYDWRNLQFKIDFDRQIFEKLLNGNFIYSYGFWPEICWEELAEEIFLHILFYWRCLSFNRDLMYNKPAHYSLPYGIAYVKMGLITLAMNLEARFYVLPMTIQYQ